MLADLHAGAGAEDLAKCVDEETFQAALTAGSIQK
jgi:hypothetical protein